MSSDLVWTCNVPRGKVGALIGPGGATINGIRSQFRCRVSVNSERLSCTLSASNAEDLASAKTRILFLLSGSQAVALSGAVVIDLVESDEEPPVEALSAKLTKSLKFSSLPIDFSQQVEFNYRQSQLRVSLSAGTDSRKISPLVPSVRQQFPGTTVEVNDLHVIVRPRRFGDVAMATNVLVKLFSEHCNPDSLREKIASNVKPVQLEPFRDHRMPLWCSGGICTGETQVEWNAAECPNQHKLGNGWDKVTGGEGYAFCRYCPKTKNDNRIVLERGRFQGKNPLLLNHCPNRTHLDDWGNVRFYHSAWISCQGLLIH